MLDWDSPGKNEMAVPQKIINWQSKLSEIKEFI